MAASDRPPRSSAHLLTLWSLLALALGLGVGLLLHTYPGPVATGIVKAVSPVGELWIALLRMTVVPLVLTQMFVAVSSPQARGSIAVLGGKALLLFVAFLLLAGLYTIVAAPPLIAMFPVDPAQAAALKAGTVVSDAARAAGQAGHLSIGGWFVDLIPTNLIQAASGNEILPLLVFTVLFALAASRLPEAQRDALYEFGKAIADAIMVLVRWILKVTPLGVLALSLVLTASAGAMAAGFMGGFVALTVSLMIVFTLLLYPITALLGGVSLRRFAKAVAPAQLVAASSRSSIASLPALVEGARDHLQLPGSATGFVLPFSVSAFKVNMTITGVARLLFVGHVFGVNLTAGAIATFLVTVVVTSFSRAGLPNGGSAFRNLPAYLAAGLPIEGIVILEAVDTIPDIFKTIINVTGDMSAATILARGEPREAV